MAFEEFITFINWGVGAAGAIGLIVSQVRASKLAEKSEYRDAVDDLLKLKEDFIKDLQTKNEQLETKNADLQKTIKSQDSKLKAMQDQITELERSYRNGLEKLLLSASQSTLCVNAPNCMNRIPPTHD